MLAAPRDGRTFGRRRKVGIVRRMDDDGGDDHRGLGDDNGSCRTFLKAGIIDNLQGGDGMGDMGRLRVFLANPQGLSATDGWDNRTDSRD